MLSFLKSKVVVYPLLRICSFFVFVFGQECVAKNLLSHDKSDMNETAKILMTVSKVKTPL